MFFTFPFSQYDDAILKFPAKIFHSVMIMNQFSFAYQVSCGPFEFLGRHDVFRPRKVFFRMLLISFQIR